MKDQLNPKIRHLSEAQIQALMSRYYDGEPIDALLHEYRVACHPSQLCKLFPPEVLPEKHAQYQPRGAEFLLVVVEGAPPGEAATLQSLDLWGSTVGRGPYPTAIEPAGGLRQSFGPNDYPDNIVVDTRDMTIRAIEFGAPDEEWWSAMEDLLGPPD